MEVQYPEDCKKVLDKGFVKLVNVMGDDSSIVQAARVSYGKGTKTVNEDTGLIRYLLRNKHTTPFEMVEFVFSIRCPIFVARQWFRHRTASYNEVSGRYSEMEDMYYVPDPSKITKQSTSNKQGGTDEVLEEPLTLQDLFAEEQREAHKNYSENLETGMRKELARINLPLSLYTTFYFKMNLHNLLHFLRLRLDPHAQYEIRVYGEAIAEYVKEIVPIAWKAFEDYSLNAVNFSFLELELLSKCIGSSVMPTSEDIFTHFKNKRESEEFISKLNKLMELNNEDS